MLPAEPSDLKGLCIIVMMRVCSGMSADLAFLLDQFAALEPALHREMGSVLCSILLAPIGLPRARRQFRLSHDRQLPWNMPNKLTGQAFIEQIWPSVSTVQPCRGLVPVMLTPPLATFGTDPVRSPPG